MKKNPRFTYTEIPNNSSENLRRHDRMMNMEQAVANQCVEGFTPSADYLDDCQKYVNGELTSDDLIQRTKARHSISDVNV
ncbi:MAG: antitoxin VbhA family protein [Candidatus Saccharibacteria bacterium]|nr:antitoxin VbhA family protein [Candidatus Saccharibacteria bacterium]